jgi:putative transposase
MADRLRMTAAQLVDKLLASDHADVLRDSIAWLVAELMDAEVARLTGAELGERAPERRTTQRNGYRSRTWDTASASSSWPSPSCGRAATFPAFGATPAGRAGPGRGRPGGLCQRDLHP